MRDTRKRPSARAQFLDVALALFNERGSAGVTTNQIAEAAGRSPGNLYYHFRDKEEIIRHLLDRLIARWAEIYALPPGRAPTLVDLDRMLVANFDALWQYRFIYRDLPMLLQRDAMFREAYGAARRSGFANFRYLLAHFAEAGVILPPQSETDADELAQLLWIVGDYWLPFIEAGGHDPARDQINQGSALFRRVLKPYLRT